MNGVTLTSYQCWFNIMSGTLLLVEQCYLGYSVGVGTCYCGGHIHVVLMWR